MKKQLIKATAITLITLMITSNLACDVVLADTRVYYKGKYQSINNSSSLINTKVDEKEMEMQKSLFLPEATSEIIDTSTEVGGSTSGITEDRDADNDENGNTSNVSTKNTQLKTYYNYLLENNVISNKIYLTIDNDDIESKLTGLSAGANAVIDKSLLDQLLNQDIEKDKVNTAISKSDLLMSLYRATYGEELSNPIAIRYEIPTEYVESGEDKIIVCYPNGGVFTYVSANVYEIYLNKMLEKGIISSSELSCKIVMNEYKSNFTDLFLEGYLNIQKGASYPNWYNFTRIPTFNNFLKAATLDSKIKYTNRLSYRFKLNGDKSIRVADAMSDNLDDLPLGKSTLLSEKSGVFMLREFYVQAANNVEEQEDVIEQETDTSTDITNVNYPTVNYFKKEKLTVMEGLEYIERFLRLTEKDMTEREAQIVNYKCKVQLLNSLTENEKSTISFLIAKGILNYESDDDYGLYTDVMRSLTWEDVLRLLYRVKNKEARFDFSQVQMTDSDEFWQNKGYVETTINLKNNVPDMEVVSTVHKKLVKEKDSSVVSEKVPYNEEDHSNDEMWLEDSADDLEIIDEFRTTDNNHTEISRDDITKSVSFLLTKIKTWKDNICMKFIDKNFETLDADTSKTDYFQVNMILAQTDNNGNSVTYVYGGEDIGPDKTVPNVKFNKEAGGSITGYYSVTFNVAASTRNQAIAIVQQKLKIKDSNTSISSVQGICQMTSTSGKRTTLISQDALANLCKNIRIIDDNTFMNTDTGTCATILTNQKELNGKSIAFVGNKVVICDDMVVTDNTSVIYYNLEVICALLSNASLKNIGGNTEIVCNTQVEEELYDVISSKKTLIEKDYVTTFRGLTANSAEQKFYNLDLMSRALNSINRTWDNVTISNSKGEQMTAKITLIVDWNYVIPDNTVNASVSTLKDKDENLKLEDINLFLVTEPTNEDLKGYWQRNLAVSNALVNAIYGTSGQQYVRCGWLVPSITILTTAGARPTTESKRIKDSTLTKSTYILSSGTLSDVQLSNFFKKIGIDITSASLSMGYNDKSSVANTPWYEFYYLDVAEGEDDRTSKIMRENSEYFSFKMYLGKRINATKEGGDNCAVYAYGSTSSKDDAGEDSYATSSKYVITNNNVIYKSFSDDENRLVVDHTQKTITKQITGDSKVQQPTRAGAEVTAGDTITKEHKKAGKYTFAYRGVTDDGKYYKLTVANVSGAKKREDVFFTCSYIYDNSKLSQYNTSTTQKDALNGKVRMKESDTILLDKYIHVYTEGIEDTLKTKTYKEYTEDIYKDLGISEGKCGSAEEFYNYCADYDSNTKLSKDTWHLQFTTNKSGKKHEASAVYDGVSSYPIYKLFNGQYNSEKLLLKKKLTANPFTMQVTIQVPTDEYYFTTEGTDYKLQKGVTYGILASEVNFAGLNNLMRDTLYAQSASVTKANSISKNAELYIAGMRYKKTDKDWFVSDVIQDSSNTCANLINLYRTNNKDADTDAIKSFLLKTDYLGCTITTGGRQYCFASFVTDIGVGPLSAAVTSSYKGNDKEDAGKNVQLYSKGGKLWCYNGKANEVKPPKEDVTNVTSNCYCIKIKLADELLCRALNDDGSSYELLTVTDAYAGSSLGKLPFVYNNILDTNEEQEDLSFTLGGFNPTTFTKSLKEKFLDDYNDLFQDNLLSFVRLLFINVLMYLMVITWVAFGILKSRIAVNLLQALAQGESFGGGNRKGRGVDLLKIFTLGIYDINDKPSISKLLFMDTMFTIIIYFLFNGFT